MFIICCCVVLLLLCVNTHLLQIDNNLVKTNLLSLTSQFTKVSVVVQVSHNVIDHTITHQDKSKLILQFVQESNMTSLDTHGTSHQIQFQGVSQLVSIHHFHIINSSGTHVSHSHLLYQSSHFQLQASDCV